VLLLLGDGTQVPVTELPGRGPWTFLIVGPASAGADPTARFLTRSGRAVVPDLRGRPGWGEPPDGPGFLDLVDDLDQVRTRAGLGRPVLVGVADLAPVALRAAVDQPWAWRALVLAPPAAQRAAADELAELDLPVLLLDAASWERLGEGEGSVAGAVERLLGRLGGGPGWSGIAPDAPPR
jgi:pimeloyl-ACP methyl ester carboxylesterase